LRSSDFGAFVIFAAIYAAGTLGLGRLLILGFEVKPGEIGSPLVAMFGFPAILGLVFGQFVANTASPLGPMDLISPIVSFAGLIAIRYSRRFSVLAGLAVYVALTSTWLAYLLSLRHGLMFNSAIIPALGGQSIAATIGYIIYHLIKRLELFKAAPPAITEPASATQH